ncbi:winged helix-turn-helix transcriptional regulator [Amycolatopsis rhizosphaerae]|uniref:Winged helix-turn-helix transcriptional regulator n=1 Tax=Amycolatopsis rhizosphaerae TaxID=2053003 RepID=A0A558CXG5_9PSEU|nr:winged helix-turn-helix domain-containing protein [Amycolatopsis rhizosphaerae]TVT53436.1 winged helix-turn-helix transcriptional regulator [Amycolatopsis rhizosphaerae]
MTEPRTVTPFDPDADPLRYRYELLADHLAELIGAGELRPKAPLPAEQQLATQFGVSLGTARHATKLLQKRGLVITVRSKGTYVAPAEWRRPDGQA